MKAPSKILFILIVLLFIANSVQAQKVSFGLNFIPDITTLSFGLSGDYEEFKNIEAQLIFGDREQSSLSNFENLSVFGLNAGYRVYLYRSLPNFDEGLFFLPTVGYNWATYFPKSDVSSTVETRKSDSYNMGMGLGYIYRSLGASASYIYDDVFDTEYYTFKVYIGIAFYGG